MMQDINAGAACSHLDNEASPFGQLSAVLVQSGILLLLLPEGALVPASGTVRLPHGEAGWHALDLA